MSTQFPVNKFYWAFLAIAFIAWAFIGGYSITLVGMAFALYLIISRYRKPKGQVLVQFNLKDIIAFIIIIIVVGSFSIFIGPREMFIAMILGMGVLLFILIFFLLSNKKFIERETMTFEKTGLPQRLPAALFFIFGVFSAIMAFYLIFGLFTSTLFPSWQIEGELFILILGIALSLFSLACFVAAAFYWKIAKKVKAK